MNLFGLIDECPSRPADEGVAHRFLSTLTKLVKLAMKTNEPSDDKARGTLRGQAERGKWGNRTLSRDSCFGGGGSDPQVRMPYLASPARGAVHISEVQAALRPLSGCLQNFLLI